jgi:hypothetical protein
MSKMDYSDPAIMRRLMPRQGFGSGLAANRNEQKVNMAEMTT